LALPGLAVSALDIDAPEVRFDLKLDISERPEGFSALFEFNTDVLDAETVAAMARQFMALLQHFVARPDERLSTAAEPRSQEARVAYGSRAAVGAPDIQVQSPPSHMVSTSRERRVWPMSDVKSPAPGVPPLGAVRRQAV